MVRPVAFRMNEQTIENNHFQKIVKDTLPETINAKAQQEFDTLVAKLKKAGVHVVVVDDTLEPNTPDSIFPNNWISFHENGDVVLYPMFAENRRAERREDILDILEDDGFVINEIMDYTIAEEAGVFLEGTGSLLLDRENGKAYCALSPRTDEELMILMEADVDFVQGFWLGQPKSSVQAACAGVPALIESMWSKFADYEREHAGHQRLGFEGFAEAVLAATHPTTPDRVPAAGGRA